MATKPTLPSPSSNWKTFDPDQWIFFERFTSAAAAQMIKRSGILQLTSPSHISILDNACGTGMVTKTLYNIDEEFATGDNVRILCTDISNKMVESVEQLVAERRWTNVRAMVANSSDLKLPDDEFTHVFTNFGPVRLAETFRVLKPGGQLNFTSWNHADWIEYVAKAWSRILYASNLGLDSALRAPPPLPDLSAIILRSQGPWDDRSYIRSQLLATNAVDPSSIIVELFPCSGIAPNAHILSRRMGLPLSNVLGACGFKGEKEKEAFMRRLLEELEGVFTEEFGEGACTLKSIATIVSAVKLREPLQLRTILGEGEQL